MPSVEETFELREFDDCVRVHEREIKRVERVCHTSNACDRR